MGQNIFAFNKISSYNITSTINTRVNYNHCTLHSKNFYKHVTKTVLLWPFHTTRHPIKKKKKGNFRRNCIINDVRTSNLATLQALNIVLKRTAPFSNLCLNIFSYITIMYFQNNFEQKASCAMQNTKILSNLNLPATSPFTAITTILNYPNRLLTPSLALGNFWNNSPLSTTDISIVCMCSTMDQSSNKSEVAAK